MQANTKIQEQASSKFGGGGKDGERRQWVVTSISYSYYVLTEYIVM